MRDGPGATPSQLHASEQQQYVPPAAQQALPGRLRSVAHVLTPGAALPEVPRPQAGRYTAVHTVLHPPSASHASVPGAAGPSQQQQQPQGAVPAGWPAGPPQQQQPPGLGPAAWQPPAAGMPPYVHGPPQQQFPGPAGPAAAAVSAPPHLGPPGVSYGPAAYSQAPAQQFGQQSAPHGMPPPGMPPYGMPVFLPPPGWGVAVDTGYNGPPTTIPPHMLRPVPVAPSQWHTQPPAAHPGFGPPLQQSSSGAEQQQQSVAPRPAAPGSRPESTDQHHKRLQHARAFFEKEMGERYDGRTPVEAFVRRVKRTMQRMQEHQYQWSDSDIASFIVCAIASKQLAIWAAGKSVLREPTSSAEVLEELSRVLRPRTDLQELACQKCLQQPAATAVGQYDSLVSNYELYMVPQPSGTDVRRMLRFSPARMQNRLPLLMSEVQPDHDKHNMQLLQSACVTYDSQVAQEQEEQQRNEQQQLIQQLQAENARLHQERAAAAAAAGQAGGGGGGRYGGGGRHSRGGRGGRDGGRDGGRGRGRGGRPEPAADDEGDLGPLAEPIGPGDEQPQPGPGGAQQQQRQSSEQRSLAHIQQVLAKALIPINLQELSTVCASERAEQLRSVLAQLYEELARPSSGAIWVDVLAAAAAVDDLLQAEELQQPSTPVQLVRPAAAAAAGPQQQQQQQQQLWRRRARAERWAGVQGAAARQGSPNSRQQQQQQRGR
ncbi:hypothetical protein OEZ86_004402 [Tetradesmus obliquus]|nr:hypothetical protein OEZ86_004402 [Tetradesmus obliquus]